MIRLKYEYNLPHKDIGLRLKISENNSRQRLYKCLEQLAIVIEEEGLTQIVAEYYPGVVNYIEKYLKKRWLKTMLKI